MLWRSKSQSTWLRTAAHTYWVVDLINARSVSVYARFKLVYSKCFLEMKMARQNLGSMSVDALLQLRDDIGKVLSQKADQLKDQLSRLGAQVDNVRRGPGSSLKGRKVAIKYRDKDGNAWAGRGAQPVWLREKLKAGSKLADFAVEKTAASRKASPRKTTKRRRKE